MLAQAWQILSHLIPTTRQNLPCLCVHASLAALKLSKEPELACPLHTFVSRLNHRQDTAEHPLVYT